MDLDVLRQLKKQKKMTNRQLSLSSGVPLGTINKLMSGVTDNPKLPTVQAIARALGTTVDKIASGTVSDGAALPLDPEDGRDGAFLLSLRERQLLTLLRQLDDRGFDTVFSAARMQAELLGAAPAENTPFASEAAPAADAPSPTPAEPEPESLRTVQKPPVSQPAPAPDRGQLADVSASEISVAETSAAGKSANPEPSEKGRPEKSPKEEKPKGGKGQKDGKKGKKGKKHKS